MTSATYGRFLTSADVATWATCVEESRHAVDAARDDSQRDAALAEGLCMAIYLAWMAGASGDLAAADHANDVFDDFRARVVSSPLRPRSSGGAAGRSS